MNGMRVYEGVVESRADPLMLGRCKVRVVGVHTEDTELLPTIDLPWAVPMGSINSASVSGIGHAPVGPVESTWVYVFFADGELNRQQPVMMGTIYGIPESQSQPFDDKAKSIIGTTYEGMSDTPGSGDGQSGTSGNGKPGTSGFSQVAGTPGEQVLTQTSGSGASGSSSKAGKTDSNGSYKLGQISGKYESGGGTAGAGTVSSGKGDLGGVSYGSHQLASYRDQQGNSKGKGSTNSPVEQFVKGSKYAKDFQGLTPGTPAFTNKWKEIAAKDPQGFEETQYQYFKGEYYNKGSNNIRAAGIDLSGRGPAVQEAIWSTSIQYGQGGARKVFVRALNGKDIGKMSDAEIVSAIQDDKLKNVDNDFKSSSEKVKAGIRNRIPAEKAELVKLAGDDGKQSEADKEKEETKKDDNTLTQTDNENTSERGENSSTEASNTGGDYTEDSEYSAPKNPTAPSGVKDPNTVVRNIRPGFIDPNLKYPLKNWLGESDASRLARNQNIHQTIIESKRNSLVQNVQTAGGTMWNEPASPYAAKYPLNHVFQSESGHFQEFDDTPNVERIHVYHRAGSFVEFHPNGNVVYKSVKDQFEVTVANRNIYVGGNCNVTVAGDSNVYTKGVARMESDGDMFIKTKSNMRIGAEGTLHMESNGEMFVGSRGNLNAAGSNIFLNCGWSAASVLAGGYNAGNIAVQVMYDVAAVVTPIEEAGAIKDLQDDGTIPKPGTGGSTGGGTGGTGGETGGGTTPNEGTGNEQPKEETPEEKPKCEGCCQFEEKDISSDLKLSTNFKLADLTTSAHYGHALRAQGGLSKAEIANNLCKVANEILEPIVKKYGRASFIITSGFRGGSGTSQHLKGEAVDIQFPGVPESGVVARAEEIASLVPYDQMILEYHGNKPVFHISHGPKNRKQKLSTPNLQKYFQGFRKRDMSAP